MSKKSFGSQIKTSNIGSVLFSPVDFGIVSGFAKF